MINKNDVYNDPKYNFQQTQHVNWIPPIYVMNIFNNDEN